ncbi:MAG: cation/acetate symporter ActP [Gemmatimonadaceae bacterium]|nr:cation/acetate symporter ActP [Gemmatimonadaceae bacterium]
MAFFFGFIAVTLGITYWAARRTRTTEEFYAAGRTISAGQNGFALAGDYMSAASFLGIAGLVSTTGFDGLIYSTGWLVGWPVVLFLIAEPLRNLGKYTFADVVASRLRQAPVRIAAAIGTLATVTFYLIAQMVGAGGLIRLMFGLTYETAIVLVGAVMILYVLFGGMIATTWVQIVKAVLLMGGTLLISILVLARFDGSLVRFFDAIGQVTYTEQGVTVTRDFLTPGLRYRPPYGPLELVSLGLALIFGTAGLPHILVRFYTVPDARTARVSVMWAMVIIGLFYVMTTFLGFGAATILTPGRITSENMSAPLLAQALGGEVFFAFISAVAFATILAVVAGLTISASTSFAHDFYTNVLHHGRERREDEEVRIARITAFVVGALSIALAIRLQNANVAFLVGLAFAVAASANLPVIVLSIFWRRFNTAGACWGIGVGLVSSIVLIALSPSVMGTAPGALIQHEPLFPLKNPGILSIPLGFAGAVIGTLFGRALPDAEAKFAELAVRANTGIGAEKASAH